MMKLKDLLSKVTVPTFFFILGVIVSHYNSEVIIEYRRIFSRKQFHFNCK